MTLNEVDDMCSSQGYIRHTI